MLSVAASQASFHGGVAGFAATRRRRVRWSLLFRAARNDRRLEVIVSRQEMDAIQICRWSAWCALCSSRTCTVVTCFRLPSRGVKQVHRGSRNDFLLICTATYVSLLITQATIVLGRVAIPSGHKATCVSKWSHTSGQYLASALRDRQSATRRAGCVRAPSAVTSTMRLQSMLQSLPSHQRAEPMST